MLMPIEQNQNVVNESVDISGVALAVTSYSSDSFFQDYYCIIYSYLILSFSQKPFIHCTCKKMHFKDIGDRPAAYSGCYTKITLGLLVSSEAHTIEVL